MSVSRSTRLTELTDVSLRTGTHLDPRGSRSIGIHVCSLQLDIVQESCPVISVRSANLDGSQVTQNRDEILCPQSRRPTVKRRIFMQPESIGLRTSGRNGVSLTKDRLRNCHSCSFQNHIFKRCSGSFFSDS